MDGYSIFIFIKDALEVFVSTMILSKIKKHEKNGDWYTAVKMFQLHATGMG